MAVVVVVNLRQRMADVVAESGIVFERCLWEWQTLAEQVLIRVPEMIVPSLPTSSKMYHLKKEKHKQRRSHANGRIN